MLLKVLNESADEQEEGEVGNKEVVDASSTAQLITFCSHQPQKRTPGEDEMRQHKAADNQHVGRVILGTACCGERCVVSLKSS